MVGWSEVDYPLIEAHAPIVTDADQTIAAMVAERIPDGATIQAGIGGMPNALLALLKGHRDLGVHTELLSDGVIDLVDAGVVTGTQKTLRRGKIVTTLALGSKRLYDFLHENSAVDFAPVEWVNDPRVIAREPNFVAINATTEVDFYGQCASETVAGRYFSSSGGQYDFSRGAMYSEGGQGFIVLQVNNSRWLHVQDQANTYAWFGRHDVKEHGRQDRNRVRRRGDEGQDSSATCRGADQHCGSAVP